MIVLMAILVITPLFSRAVHPAVAFFAFILWAIDSINKQGLNFLFGDRYGVAKWWIILIGWEILLSFIGFSTTEPNTFILRRLPVYLTPLIGLYCIRTYSIREIRSLFLILCAIIFINLFLNIGLWLRNPEVFEGISRFEAIESRLNIADTAFVHDILFLLPLLYILYHSSFIKGKRILFLFVILLSILFISYINPRATAFFILILYVFALFFVRRANKSNLHGITRVLLYAIALGLVVAFAVPVLEWMASLLPERMAVRINDTIESINGGTITNDSEEGSLYVRWMLAQVSLDTWLSGPINFIFGKGEDLAASGRIDDLISLGIGQHSEFVDFLAKYGLFGAFLLYKALHSTFTFILSLCYNDSIKSYVRVTMIGFLVMSTLNNTLIADNVIVVFIMLPSSIILSQKYLKRT